MKVEERRKEEEKKGKRGMKGEVEKSRNERRRKGAGEESGVKQE